MGVLLIKCPKTGFDLSTGIQIDSATLARTPQVPSQTRCPHCGSEHFWMPREAILVDAISHRDWVENQRGESNPDAAKVSSRTAPEFD
jgi:DNA-directed RNA polymerase subunit RPC12/RpoP